MCIEISKYTVLISFIQKDDTIIGCKTFNILNFICKCWYGEDMYDILNNVSKETLKNYGIITENNTIIQNSYTMVSKFYGYVLLVDAIGDNMDSIVTLSEHELCINMKKLTLDNSIRFTNFKTERKINDSKGFLIHPTQYGISDVSIAFLTGRLDVYSKTAEFYISSRLETIFNAKIKKLGTTKNSIKHLDSNAKAFKDVEKLCNASKMAILNRIHKNQRVRENLLETISIFQIIEDYYKALK